MVRNTCLLKCNNQGRQRKKMPRLKPINHDARPTASVNQLTEMEVYKARLGNFSPTRYSFMAQYLALTTYTRIKTLTFTTPSKESLAQLPWAAQSPYLLTLPSNYLIFITQCHSPLSPPLPHTTLTLGAWRVGWPRSTVSEA